jgi:hypothetical protein
VLPTGPTTATTKVEMSTAATTKLAAEL